MATPRSRRRDVHWDRVALRNNRFRLGKRHFVRVVATPLDLNREHLLELGSLNQNPIRRVTLLHVCRNWIHENCQLHASPIGKSIELSATVALRNLLRFH